MPVFVKYLFDIITGFAHIVLLMQVTFLHRRRREFSKTIVYYGAVIVFVTSGLIHLSLPFLNSAGDDRLFEFSRDVMFAVVSVIGALWLGQTIKRINLLPTLEELSVKNLRLNDEIQLRQDKEDQLVAAHNDLERQVEQRTNELSHAVSEMRTANETLTALATASPLAILMLDRKKHVCFWNPAAERLFGWKKEEVLGRPLPSVPQSKMDEFESLVSSTASRMSRGPVETQRLHKNGTLVDVCIWNAPLTAPHESEASPITMAIIEDISERTRIQRELQAAKTCAERANAAKTSFLANVSHEIRTPLGAVMGFAELLHRKMPGPENQHFLDIIRRNAKLVDNIITDILDISKVDAGQLQLELGEVNVAEVVSEVAATLSAQASKKGIALNIKCLPGLSILADATRIRQILLNIIGNAVKFTQHGSVDIEAVRIEGHRAILSVSDTGPGMPPEKMARLFEPFVQGDASVYRKFGGTGLGLFLARKLAHAMGGDVRLVCSVADRGTKFEIELPALKQKVEAVEGNERRPSSSSLSAIQRILIVEDNEELRELMFHCLEGTHANIEFAFNGNDGVKMALDANPDVVFMDIQMPGMDGLTATAKLRASGFKNRIIAVSGVNLTIERDKSIAAGFDEVVSKPFLPSDLLYAMVSKERHQQNLLH